MNIEIRPVKTILQKRAFIKFQIKMYRDNPYYVPPLFQDELDNFNTKKNPIFDNADLWLYTAHEEGKMVGRIAIMVNWNEVQKQGRSKLRFGWYDVLDNIEISRALLQKVEEKAKELKLTMIEGPVGFSNLDKAGLLIEGFNEMSTMVTLYNHPYYATHLERLGYQKNLDWLEYKINWEDYLAQHPELEDGIPTQVARVSEAIKKRYHLKVVRFTKKEELKSMVDAVFSLLDASYSILPSYVPITRKQIDHYREKFTQYINPDYVSVVKDEKDEIIAFGITMPSYSKALKKIQGRIFPFGWYHLLQANRKNDTINFYLIGVKPEYQNKGVPSIIFHEIVKIFKKYNIKHIETNPELEQNKNIQMLWANYNPIQHRKRRSYIKYL